jgi:hypothetical protein
MIIQGMFIDEIGRSTCNHTLSKMQESANRAEVREIPALLFRTGCHWQNRVGGRPVRR